LQHRLLAIKVSSELIFNQGSNLLEPLLKTLSVDRALLGDLLDLRCSVHLELLQALEKWPACGLKLA
jgi:hypothetical protein